MDAFAAPVGQDIDPAAPDQFGEPAREIAADEVARRGGADPARDEGERRHRLRAPCGRAAHRILVIQQTQEILAALADDDAAALLHRVGIEPVELAGNLALQVARIGRDPHRALVPLGPQARRRDIAERLADPGAGLGEHRLRLIGLVARREGGGDRAGVIGLLRPGFGALAEQLREAAAGLVGADRIVAGWGGGRALLPLVERLPGAQADRPALIGCRQRGQHRRPPGQPPRSAISAMARALGSVSWPSSCSRARAAVASATQASAMVRGGARPSAAASPRGVGTQNCAGRTKANNSRRSSAANPAMSRRRATARAWHTIAVSPARRVLASSIDSASISPSGDSHTISRNPATSAGARGTRTRRLGLSRVLSPMAMLG